MKLRVTFEIVRGQQNAVAIELEAPKLDVKPINGWVIIECEGLFVVGYPPAVVRSVVEVGAWDKLVVKPSENSGRRQPTR